uniref:coiled-coil domain-containing protein 157 n=1 Tax=Pristiophorus japonicus TaxID=55135 RepID=UPI00398E678C
MAATARGLLKEAEAAKKIHEEDECATENGPAVVQHAVGFRRNQKMTFRQLKTCAFFLDIVKNSDVKGIQENIQQQNIQMKLTETRQKWKSLKVECRVQEEELQNVSIILQKFQALETKQQALTDAIQLYEAKKQQLEEALQQKKLQLKQEQKLTLAKEKSLIEQAIKECSLCISKCHTSIQQAQQTIQLLAKKDSLTDCVHFCDFHTLSQLYQTMETQSGVKILELPENQVTLQFDPRALIPLTKLSPLELTVVWTMDGRVKLETNCAFLDLSEMESVDLRNITAEIWKRYMSQAELWGEIQLLQHRYAIDWLENERKLKFLQSIAGSSSNIVCTLYIEIGYPGNGEVKLSSIQEKNGPIDTVIEPPQAKPSLTDWLEYLNTLECWKG